MRKKCLACVVLYHTLNDCLILNDCFKNKEKNTWQDEGESHELLSLCLSCIAMAWLLSSYQLAVI